MIELQSILTGIIVGILFSTFNFPIPAPPSLAGILGIMGIYLGFKIRGLL